MYKFLTVTILMFLFCSLNTLAIAFEDNDTKFQQYSQPIAKEPIDYFRLSPYFYHPSLFMPHPITIYNPYGYQYLDERARINSIREDNTLEDPEIYNIHKNNKK